MSPREVGEEPVYGLVKLAAILRRSSRTLERQLDTLPEAKQPPIYTDDMGRYWAYETELRFWMRLNHMHASRARELERARRTAAHTPGLVKCVDGAGAKESAA